MSLAKAFGTFAAAAALCGIAAAQTQTIRFPSRVHLLFWSPNDRYVCAFPYIYDLKLRRLHRLPKRAGNIGASGFSPEGSCIYYWDAAQNATVKVDWLRDKQVDSYPFPVFGNGAFQGSLVASPVYRDPENYKNPKAILIYNTATGARKLVTNWTEELAHRYDKNLSDVGQLDLSWTHKHDIQVRAITNGGDTSMNFVVDPRSGKIVRGPIYGEGKTMSDGSLLVEHARPRSDVRYLKRLRFPGDRGRLGFAPGFYVTDGSEEGTMGTACSPVNMSFLVFGARGTKQVESDDPKELAKLPLGTAYLWIVDARTGRHRLLEKKRTRFTTVEAAFSPDGKWIAYEMDRLHKVYIRPCPKGY